MPGPRVKGKRSSAVQLRAAHVRPLQSGSLLAVRPFEKVLLFVIFFTPTANFVIIILTRLNMGRGVEDAAPCIPAGQCYEGVIL